MKTLNLTIEQASTLHMFLLLTTKYRQREKEACERLGLETKEDGSPRYPNMKANAEWWKNANDIIEEIQKMF